MLRCFASFLLWTVMVIQFGTLIPPFPPHLVKDHNSSGFTFEPHVCNILSFTVITVFKLLGGIEMLLFSGLSPVYRKTGI